MWCSEHRFNGCINDLFEQKFIDKVVSFADDTSMFYQLNLESLNNTAEQDF